MHNFINGFIKQARTYTQEEWLRINLPARIGKMGRLPGAHDSDGGSSSSPESAAGNSATVGTSAGVSAGASGAGGAGGAGS